MRPQQSSGRNRESFDSFQQFANDEEAIAAL